MKTWIVLMRHNIARFIITNVMLATTSVMIVGTLRSSELPTRRVFIVAALTSLAWALLAMHVAKLLGDVVEELKRRTSRPLASSGSFRIEPDAHSFVLAPQEVLEAACLFAVTTKMGGQKSGFGCAVDAQMDATGAVTVQVRRVPNLAFNTMGREDIKRLN